MASEVTSLRSRQFSKSGLEVCDIRFGVRYKSAPKCKRVAYSVDFLFDVKVTL